MPQRSNLFQQTVKAIEAAFAGTGATVVESAMVRNNVGYDTEVDILITTNTKPRKLRIAVEARDRSRNAQASWIQELHGKYVSIPDIQQVVAVSSSPFARQAIDLARSLGIETRVVTDLENVDWSALKGIVRPGQYFETSVEILSYPIWKVADGDRSVIPDDARVFSESFGVDTSYADFTKRITESIRDELSKDPKYQRPSAFIPFKKVRDLTDHFVIREGGAKQELVSIGVLVFEIRHTAHPMNISRKSYGDEPVTVAHFENEYYRKTVVETTDESGKPRVHEEPIQFKGIGFKTINLKPSTERNRAKRERRKKK